MAANRNALFFGTPDDIVDRNIIPFAKLLFSDLIDEKGSIQGAAALKAILDLDFKTCSAQGFPKETGSTIFRSVINPFETLMAQIPRERKVFINKKDAQVIFYIQLVGCLQEHYLEQSKTANNETMQALAWIPQWCKNKCVEVHNALLPIHPLKHSSYAPTQTRLMEHSMLLVILAAWYFFFAQQNQRDKNLAMIFSAVIIARFLRGESDRYMNASLDKYKKKLASDRYSEYFGNRALRLLDQIEKTTGIAAANEEKRDTAVDALFNGPSPC